MPKYFGRLAAILFLLAAFSCFLTAALGSADQRATRMIVGGVIAVLAGAVLFFDTFLRGVKKPEPCQPDNAMEAVFQHHDGTGPAQEPSMDLSIPIQERHNNEQKRRKQARRHIYWAH